MTRLLLALICLLVTSACRGDSSSGSDSTPTAITMPSATATTSEARLDTLDGTEWIVTEVGDAPVAQGFVVRFRFVNGNVMSAQIACDGASTNYRLTGAFVTLTDRIQ